jgi:hypothetical protein
VYKKGIAYHPENIDLHLRLIWLLQNNYPIEVAIQATKSAALLVSVWKRGLY